MSFLEEFEPTPLSPPTTERVREVGLQIAELAVRRLDGKLFDRPYSASIRDAEKYYQAVALSQSAAMEVLNQEISHEWTENDLSISICTHWDEHPQSRINRKIHRGYLPRDRLLRSQYDILTKGITDLIRNRIVRVNRDDYILEIDPVLSIDFDPLSGEAVNEPYSF